MKRRLRHILLVFITLVNVALAYGQTVVSGLVLEQDSITPIAGASVVFSGIGAEGDTLLLQSISDTTGFYETDIEDGNYQVSVYAEGYSTVVLPDSLSVGIGGNVLEISFVLYEFFQPVNNVEATLLYDDFVRVTWTMSESVSSRCDSRQERSFRYFDLFRRRFNEDPVMLVSHLTDTVFMEMHWNNLDWGQYCWGVSCHYEGNRGDSDTVWSAYLDKEMTTSFLIEVTTDIGLPSEGALVSLQSELFDYQDTIGCDGRLQMDGVYRGNYAVQVSLDGFADYVSDSLVSIMDSTHMAVELLEAVKCVDSIYVSSTGLALWWLSDSLAKDLQYFEVQVDSLLVGNTGNSWMQLDVSGFVSGEIHVVRVRPVYLSTCCEWTSCDWVYKECFEFQSVTDFNYEFSDDAVLLSWHYPDADTVLGAVLCRDGVPLGFVEGEHYVDESVVMEDSVAYGLRVVYGGPANGHCFSMSCESLLTVLFPVYCDAPTNLEGELYHESGNGFGALVSWGNRPPLIEEWLHYDNGEFKTSIGGGDEPVIFWSVRFGSDELLDYQGSMLTRVSVFDVGAGSYQLWVYKGGENAPQTLVCTQNMTFEGTCRWHEENLVSGVEILGNESLWVVVGQQGLNRPAAACADMGNPNGRWVSLNGSDWVDLNLYNLHYTWMLRAFVTNRAGKEKAIGGDDFELVQYHLYHSIDNIDYQKIASIPFEEGIDFYQYRDDLTFTTSDSHYYRLTAFYRSGDGEECESDYAASLLDPDQDYVVVSDVLKVHENQANGNNVFPNPTNGRLTIEAKGIQRVCVFNVMGQRLFEREVQSDAVQIDLSGFAVGVYQLRVTTENGIFGKRFVLSK